jgi:hypothetical protein
MSLPHNIPQEISHNHYGPDIPSNAATKPLIGFMMEYPLQHLDKNNLMTYHQ